MFQTDGKGIIEAVDFRGPYQLQWAILIHYEPHLKDILAKWQFVEAGKTPYYRIGAWKTKYDPDVAGILPPCGYDDVFMYASRELAAVASSTRTFHNVSKRSIVGLFDLLSLMLSTVSEDIFCRSQVPFTREASLIDGNI